MNQLSGSSSQSSNCAELIVRFGKCGLIVPALMFRLSASFALANALASCSVRNVSAAVGVGGLAVLLERVENAPSKSGIVDLDGCSRRHSATRGLKIADYRLLRGTT
jgi:hypothetical protein